MVISFIKFAVVCGASQAMNIGIYLSLRLALNNYHMEPVALMFHISVFIFVDMVHFLRH